MLPTRRHQEMLCIAYFTKVSSDEEACSELADLGLSRYLIRVLPERRLSLQNRCGGGGYLIRHKNRAMIAAN